MMNVVLVGGGDLGRHVASILSREKHNVILVDKEPRVIQEISSHLDIATRLGSGTDWQLLDDLLEFAPDLFIALTGNDEANLVACSIAKHLRYPRTIARVRDSRYLNITRLDFGQIFDVDYFIAPEVLVAHEILKHIINPGSLAVESFAHGALQLRTLLIPENWPGPKETLRTIQLPQNVIVGLIRRDNPNKPDTKELIFPHGDDMILPGDEVTFIGETDPISSLHEFFGILPKLVESVVIAGGSLTGLHLAQLLAQRDVDVVVIDKSYDKCCTLAERLPHATIVHHDATDLEFLKAEKIGQADIVVASTNGDEINLLTGLLSKEVGCEQVLVILKNASYIPLVTRLGMKHAVSPRISATNHILSQLFSGKVTSLISLYENKAEVIEITVSLNSKVVGIPLSELGPYLPKDLLIVMIQNRGRMLIANGNRIISPGDSVIIVTHPRHVEELGKIF